MSIKINAMVDDVKANNKEYIVMPKKIIQQYLVWKFKCSKYLANQAIKKLLENEETIQIPSVARKRENQCYDALWKRI